MWPAEFLGTQRQEDTEVKAALGTSTPVLHSQNTSIGYKKVKNLQVRLVPSMYITDILYFVRNRKQTTLGAEQCDLVFQSWASSSMSCDSQLSVTSALENLVSGLHGHLFSPLLNFDK